MIEVPTTVMHGTGLCSKRVGFSLVIMICLWVTANFNYGMIGIYMKYVPGTIFVTLSVSGLSEILAHVVVGSLYVKLTPRFTFLIGYGAALIGGSCLVF